MNKTQTVTLATLLVPIGLIAGCAGSPTRHHGGGYYQNDGPPDQTNIDLSQYPDAVPKNVPLSKYGNPSSYTALGKRYYVLKSAAGFTQTGLASWYGRQFQGERTSSGKPYNMFAMTAAHKRLPIPSWVRVTNLDNHKQVVVKINDRGPFHKGRIIDLSYLAARRLGIVGEGSAPVRIHTVTPATIDRHASSNEQNDNPTPLSREASPQPPTNETTVASTGVRDHAQPTAIDKTPHRPRRPSGGELQIGAFSSAAHATRAKARAVAAGVGPVMVVPPSTRLKLYRVRVGPFATSADRRHAGQKLADAGLPVRNVKR